MNTAGECSSGCESGWTGYLERSSWLSPNYSISYHEDEDHDGVRSGQMKINTQEEEEDMSMVSDASSGPPHFIDDSYSTLSFKNHHDCSSFYPPGGHEVETNNVVEDSAAGVALSFRSRERKKRNKDVKKQRMILDDTASSRPVPHHLFKNNEFGLRNKNPILMENHGMLDLSHGFSSTHIQDGPPAIDLFGHQYQQSQFLGGGNWMSFK